MRKMTELKLKIESGKVLLDDGIIDPFAFSVASNLAESEDIAKRIVACVNACSGMLDPIATVNHMINQLENWGAIHRERESEEMTKLKTLVYDLREEIDRLKKVNASSDEKMEKNSLVEALERSESDLKEVRRVARELYLALSALTYGTTREFADSNGFGQQRDRALTLLKNTPPPPLQTTPKP